MLKEAEPSLKYGSFKGSYVFLRFDIEKLG